ncbi:UPF0481 protein At3g47200-like [Magnolia sinica]|uniref:UPF0481 protein At3g47200-like n=1 Tax=Magnolia sinica TaxID=86752 RepID=UPI00265A571A|nr:UPF0481 protein At3g47200-like [Magnolia sinica]
MDDNEMYQFEKKDKHDVEVEVSTSTKTTRRRFLASGGQALANSMRKSLAASVFKPRCGKPPTIYKVPQRIRQGNKDVYEPQILSIGPYHHGKKNLQGMEEHKWRYLNSILSRNSNHRLEDYLEAIKDLEDQARICYSENLVPYTGHRGNEFVKMMVLDGCFIVELFLKLKEELHELDPIFSMIWMLPLIGYDMLLLENQIPFLVLQCIFEMASPVDKPVPYSLPELALDFFDLFMPRNKEILIRYPVHHLLHLFHSHLIPTPTRSIENSNNRPCNRTTESIPNKWKNLLTLLRSNGLLPNSNKAHLPITNNQSTLSPPPVPIKMIPCATELQLTGVKFKKKEKWSSILDVKFRNGVMEIPPLSVNAFTDSLFRNLVAFEQCYPNARIRFTTYVSFMDCIVNTSKDVALLHRDGIIDHLLGSDEEVAQLFNRLGNGTFDFENNYLSDLYKDVEQHCKTKWNMRWASLRRDYFTNPWASVSSVAAAILLVVTLTQTFFAVFSYFKSPS